MQQDNASELPSTTTLVTVARGRSIQLGSRIYLAGEEALVPTDEVEHMRARGFLHDPDEPVAIRSVPQADNPNRIGLQSTIEQQPLGRFSNFLPFQGPLDLPVSGGGQPPLTDAEVTVHGGFSAQAARSASSAPGIEVADYPDGPLSNRSYRAVGSGTPERYRAGNTIPARDALDSLTQISARQQPHVPTSPLVGP